MDTLACRTAGAQPTESNKATPRRPRTCPLPYVRLVMITGSPAACFCRHAAVYPPIRPSSPSSGSCNGSPGPDPVGEVEVTAEWPEGVTIEVERASPAAEPPADPEQLLVGSRSRVRDGRPLVTKIAHLIRFSRELRSHRYTRQVTLHLGNGLANPLRQEEWAGGRTREVAEPIAPIGG